MFIIGAISCLAGAATLLALDGAMDDPKARAILGLAEYGRILAIIAWALASGALVGSLREKTGRIVCWAAWLACSGLLRFIMSQL